MLGVFAGSKLAPVVACCSASIAIRVSELDRRRKEPERSAASGASTVGSGLPQRQAAGSA
jgi:hypothetical protein